MPQRTRTARNLLFLLLLLEILFESTLKFFENFWQQSCNFVEVWKLKFHCLFEQNQRLLILSSSFKFLLNLLCQFNMLFSRKSRGKTSSLSMNYSGQQLYIELREHITIKHLTLYNFLST